MKVEVDALDGELSIQEGKLYDDIKEIVDEARENATATADRIARDTLDKIKRALDRGWYSELTATKLSALDDIARYANEALEIIKELQSFAESN